MKSNRNRSVSFVQSDGGPFRSGVIVWVPMQHPSVGRGSHSIFMLGNRLSMSKLTDLHGNV